MRLCRTAQSDEAGDAPPAARRREVGRLDGDDVLLPAHHRVRDEDLPRHGVHGELGAPIVGHGADAVANAPVRLEIFVRGLHLEQEMDTQVSG